MSRISPVLGRLRGWLGRDRGWLGQDVARTNAAQASVRLKHASRQRRDLDAYLSRQSGASGRSLASDRDVPRRRDGRSPQP